MPSGADMKREKLTKEEKRSMRRLKRQKNLKHMKENKGMTMLYFVLRAVIIVIFVLDVIRGKYESAMPCALTLILLLIPSFIERRLYIDLPDVMETIMILFVFSANIMGEIGAFYEKIPIWDTILHTLNGFICAGVGFGLIDILNRNEKVKMNLSPLFVCLFSFCFSMTAGTIWEFFEFGVDSLLGKDMQKDTIVTTINSVLLSGDNSNHTTTVSGITDTVVNGKSLGINGYLDIGLIDTMKDLLVNFIGAVVFNFAGFFYLKGRGKKAGFIKNFIPRRITEPGDGTE